MFGFFGCRRLYVRSFLPLPGSVSLPLPPRGLAPSLSGANAARHRRRHARAPRARPLAPRHRSGWLRPATARGATWASSCPGAEPIPAALTEEGRGRHWPRQPGDFLPGEPRRNDGTTTGRRRYNEDVTTRRDATRRNSAARTGKRPSLLRLLDCFYPADNSPLSAVPSPPSPISIRSEPRRPFHPRSSGLAGEPRGSLRSRSAVFPLLLLQLFLRFLSPLPPLPLRPRSPRSLCVSVPRDTRTVKQKSISHFNCRYRTHLTYAQSYNLTIQSRALIRPLRKPYKYHQPFFIFTLSYDIPCILFFITLLCLTYSRSFYFFTTTDFSLILFPTPFLPTLPPSYRAQLRHIPVYFFRPLSDAA
jgi:hypothetical protein